MMRTYNRRSKTCVNEDTMSNLPEHLIDLILERVPFEDAVRTSTLSKKWRYRWTTIKALVLDEQFSKKVAPNRDFGRNKFICIINQVLILHNGPILKFHLHIPDMFLDNFQEDDQWVLLLSRKGVRELNLTTSNPPYELPSNVFSCLELTKLELKNCFFKPPLEFERFLNLQHIGLENINFRANLCITKINLPQLKKLSLSACTNVYNFNIRVTNLQMLFVYACPDAMLLQLLHNPCLSLTSVHICSMKPVKDFVQAERLTLATMLSNMPKVESLIIDGYSLKFLSAEKSPKWLQHTVTSLKDLNLLNFQLGDFDQLHGALCLLRNSPNLQKLSIMPWKKERRVDVRRASNHLKAPDCLDCTLSQLQSVYISNIKGSRAELLFIKLLLAHSPSLQKCYITPSPASVVLKRLNIAEYLMGFPRASPKAELIHLKISLHQ